MNMRLNTKQLRIVLVSIAIFIAMGLYPPWIHTLNLREKPAGYALIFSPPKPEKDSLSFGVRLDMSRLFVQWLALLSAAVGAMIIVKGRSSD